MTGNAVCDYMDKEDTKPKEKDGITNDSLE
jgi:hypothetical protein